ncbi:MAG TPA: hypothetical protein VFH51_14675, partial [Myxococcota bacterium]|nr:hypothetical protein [Myxococcota bacterium]
GQIGAAAASDDGTRMIALTPELRGVTVWALSARDGATVGGASLRHRDAIKVAITPDGRFGASGAYDGTIRFWDLRTFEASTLQHSHITALAISPNGTSVAAAYGEEVRVWLRSLGAAHPGFDLEHTAYVNRMAFSPNGKFLAARGNRLMELWRVREVGVDKVPTPKLQHGSSEALGVFSPDSRFFASANEANDAVLVFDLHAVDKPGPWEPRTLRYRKSISRIDFSPQLHRLMATTGRGLRVWDLDSEAPARPLLTKQLEHDEAHFAAEGSQIMLVPSRGTTEVLDFDIQRAAPASV